jgi:hypothetical protein
MRTKYEIPIIRNGQPGEMEVTPGDDGALACVIAGGRGKGQSGAVFEVKASDLSDLLDAVAPARTAKAPSVPTRPARDNPQG